MRSVQLVTMCIMAYASACSQSNIPNSVWLQDFNMPQWDAAVVDADKEPDFAEPADMAQCPELHPGDMFQVGHFPTIYIVTKNGEYMYFPDVPNGKNSVFLSWRYENDPVCQVNQARFDQMRPAAMYPTGVNYHPGTYLVKRAQSEQLYAILPGNTRAKISPEAAHVLYGSPYRKDGLDDTPMVIPDAYWPNLVNTAPDITDARVHPGLMFNVGSGQLNPYYLDEQYVMHSVAGYGTSRNHLESRFLRTVPFSATDRFILGAPIRDLVEFMNDPTQLR